MVKLMRCNQPHWAGNDFVPIGTVLPEGHPGVIPQYFEPFEVDGGEPAAEETAEGDTQDSGGEPAGQPATPPAPAPAPRAARRSRT